MRAAIPTTQEIKQLALDAYNGDEDAARELADLNNRIAKRANERMRELERKGLDGTAAYNRAKGFIQDADFGAAGRNYFSQSRKLTPDDAAENLMNAATFLRSQTSTLTGEMSRRDDIWDTLLERHVIDDAEKDPEEYRRRFMDFLDTNAWKDIKKHMYVTGEGMLKDAGEAIQNGAKVGDLVRAFKDYERGADTDLVEIWDNWISADKYYRGGEWHDLKTSRRRL